MISVQRENQSVDQCVSGGKNCVYEDLDLHGDDDPQCDDVHDESLHCDGLCDGGFDHNGLHDNVGDDEDGSVY